MQIRQAERTEFEAVRRFYHAVIDAMEGAEYKPAWQKDVYPDPAFLRASVENGELWLGEIDGRTVAAMVLNHDCNEGYAEVSWPHEALPEEILLIHALCVYPDFGGRGLGGELVRFAQELARKDGMKLMRLDVLKGNLPAEKLYPACGFRLVDTVTLFYEDTGWTEFEMFEYVV